MGAGRSGEAESGKGRALLELVLATLLGSTGGLLVKWVDWHPMAIAGVRSLIALPILLAFLRRPSFAFSWARAGAAVAFAGAVLTFVVAAKLTTVANAVVLQYTSPIYVVFLARWLLDERPRWWDGLSVAVAMGGVALFFLDRLDRSGLAGTLLSLAGGLSFAVMLVLLRRQKDGSPLESVAWGNALTVLAGLPFMFRSAPTPAGWAGLLLMGVFQLGLMFVLYTRAIRRVTAIEAVVVKGLEPLLTPLWVFLLLGERPGRWALWGAALVVAAVTGRSVLAAIGGRARAGRG